MTDDDSEDSVNGEGLFAGYEIESAFYDEMFDAAGSPRPHCSRLWEALNGIPPSELAIMHERAERSFLHEGITFSVYGEEGAHERIIPIDFLPRILDAHDWDLIERGLRQRIETLNLLLADIYGPGRILSDGVVPAGLVHDCPQFREKMRGVEVPHGPYVSVCGTDIVRTNDGFLVLEDNLRVPSGVSYMLANRRAVKTSFRNLFRQHRVRGIEHYGLLLRQTLAELAPSGVVDPCIVLLSPGVYNAAFYEHMFLAREMGIELVQGQDLLVHGGFVYMRTTEGLRRVDVIYRRIDDDFLDPSAFRPDSMLGVRGLFSAFRMGNVALVNETFARRFFGNESVFGRQVRFGTGLPRDVVGVVSDFYEVRLDRPIDPVVYLPASQAWTRNLGILVRLRGGGEALATELQQAVQMVDPELPAHQIRSMEELGGQAGVGFQDDGRVRRDPRNHDLTVGPSWRVWPDRSWRSSKDQRNRHPNRSWGNAAPDVVDDRSTRVQFDDHWYCFRPAVVCRDFSGPCQQIFWSTESGRSSVRWNRPDSGRSQCGYGVPGGRPHCWQESAGDPAVRLNRGASTRCSPQFEKLQPMAILRDRQG